jgi:hypothetical protein
MLLKSDKVMGNREILRNSQIKGDGRDIIIKCKWYSGLVLE